jgi:hypothetical protein
MSLKTLAWLESAYLDSLAFAQVLGCTLDAKQFCAAHRLDPCEYDEFRERLDSRGIA